MAKKNEIIVKDVSIKTMTINSDNKGVEFAPLRKPLEIDGVSLIAIQQMQVLEGNSGRILLK